MKMLVTCFATLCCIVALSLIAIGCASSREAYETDNDVQLAKVVAKRIMIDLSIFQKKTSVFTREKNDAVAIFNDICVRCLLDPTAWEKEDTSLVTKGKKKISGDNSITYIQLTDDEIIEGLLNGKGVPDYIFLPACKSLEEQKITLRCLMHEVLVGCKLAYNKDNFLHYLHEELLY